jgi:hypothetical protein
MNEQGESVAIFAEKKIPHPAPVIGNLLKGAVAENLQQA